MSTDTQIVTAEQLLRMPRGGVRYELLRGELRTMSPSGSEHAVVTARLTARLQRFVDDHQLGIVFGAEAGFLIDRDPDTVRAPDVAFIRQERVPESGIPEGFWPGAPDLAVEVTSPGDSPREVQEKVSAWLRAGASAVWVINPRSQSVHVFSDSGTRLALSGRDVLEDQNLLPGFSCPVAELFWKRG